MRNHLIVLSALLGLCVAGEAGAAKAGPGVESVLASATRKMAESGYMPRSSRVAATAQRRIDTRRRGAEKAMLTIINDAKFLSAFERQRQELVLANEATRQVVLRLDPHGRASLYEDKGGYKGGIGEVPGWLKRNISSYPGLSAKSLGTAVQSWADKHYGDGAE